MKFSKMLIPTLREVPSDAEAVSHKLMLRAGYVRQLAAGLYIYLPLGWRVLNKINRILKEEMDGIGAQEVSMPVLHPAEIWQKTGRWYDIKEEMFRLKDRTDRDMCLGMTHEEIMTWLAAREIKSYRDLPQVWYQIQTKLRDEARPKSGILRTREFIMKDSYSFDRDEEGLAASYTLHAEAYHRIFKRCGLVFYQVESDTGMMGGAEAHEFMAPSPAGEDEIVLCESCNYTANVEVATSKAPKQEGDFGEREEIHTPQKRTLKEVSHFLKAPPSSFIKSLLLIASEKPVLVLIRGDQELHEKKLQNLIGNFRPAGREEVLSTLGVEAGFIGPMGHKVHIVADTALQEGTFITGANKTDYHVRGIRPGIHFSAEWHDIHIARAGDLCPVCSHPLKTEKVIEIGNIFKLGTKYSLSLNAVFLDKNGQEHPIIMGSYGIGPARIAAAAIEQNNDKDGIIWPRSIAPYDVEIIPLSVQDSRTMEIADALHKGLAAEGKDALIDDRDERPGVKFKDADLIGIPVQVVLGEKSLKDNMIEVKVRRTKESKKVPVDTAVQDIIAIVNTTE
ncbi:MAG: proline--tRNA ligase [Alphaproteobacteria bacterium]|uniref:Proline--tRNA ligase n=1 Tax=Candidatus Nitrobium versatile TaxID=2884831 RepID=A0A953M203_9BACT|nr:proline--tRNA ligase [Candidatus Nitrobium versatile]